MTFKKGDVPWNKGMKGYSTSSTFKKGYTPWNKGKTNVYSEEHVKIMSERHEPKKHTEETLKKMREAQKGSKHHNWHGGISKLPYAFDFNGELKELIKKQDGYKCQFPDCDATEDLMVHHVDYDKMNSDPKNLITLCRKHNTKVNFNREHWTDYFNGGF